MIRYGIVGCGSMGREHILTIKAMGGGRVTALADPVGDIIDTSERPNGLLLQRVRVPLGVVGIIYESRPNVTIEAASLSIKSGNACILRGGSEALHSNAALATVLGSFASFSSRSRIISKSRRGSRDSRASGTSFKCRRRRIGCFNRRCSRRSSRT